MGEELDDLQHEFTKACLRDTGVRGMLAAIEACQQEINGNPNANLGSLLESLESQISSNVVAHSSNESKVNNNQVLVDCQNLQESIANAHPAKELTIGFPQQQQAKELNSAIIGHLLHEGLVDTACVLVGESSSQQCAATELARINQGIEALHKMETALDLAIEWLEKYASSNVSLLFEFHKAKFHQIATAAGFSNRDAALKYAHDHFGRFVSTSSHGREVELLVTRLVVPTSALHLLQPSTAPNSMQELRRLFSQELYQDSLELSNVIQAGMDVMPDFESYSKFASIHWDEQELQIPRSSNRQQAAVRPHHTVFLCPVSGETASEENPPMLLPCGHVFLLHSIQRISSRRPVFKCPTCPKELTLHDATRIYF